jgi:hypothetical protein
VSEKVKSDEFGQAPPTPSEIESIRRALEPIEQAAAKERQGRPGQTRSGKFPEHAQTRDKIGGPCWSPRALTARREGRGRVAVNPNPTQCRIPVPGSSSSSGSSGLGVEKLPSRDMRYLARVGRRGARRLEWWSRPAGNGSNRPGPAQRSHPEMTPHATER